MAETKVYTIPLRREFQKAPYKRKSNKAVKAVREYVKKHSKADRIVIGEELNIYIWSKGITNPPAKVQVEITKENVKEENVEYTEAFVNLIGKGKQTVEKKKRGILNKDSGGLKGKLQDAVETLKGRSGEAKADAETPKVEESKSEESKADAKESEEKTVTAKTKDKPKAE